jgi:hypothetical protein
VRGYAKVRAMPRPDGATLRAWRLSRHWAVPEMARHLRRAAGGTHIAGPDALKAMIHKWERDAVEISERYMLLYCKVLGLTPAQLAEGPAALAASGSAGPGAVAPGRGAFLAQAGVLLPLSAPHPSPTPEMAAACAAITENYRRLDAIAGPSAVYAQAASHQAWLASWAAQAAGPGWRQVARLHAEATILLAWLNFDLERYPQAVALYRECEHVADQLEDPDLRAFLTGRQARTLSECGRHDEALGVAEAARQLAAASACPGLKSWLAITRAYIHASRGEDYACLADIAAARAALSVPAPEAAPPYLSFYGESYLSKWEGRALLQLGSKRRDVIAGGRRAIDAALENWSPEDIRESGEVLAACASARRAQEEIPEAARLTAQAWRVATATSSPRIMRYVRQLRRDLAPWRDVDAVRELDDLILGAG